MPPAAESSATNRSPWWTVLERRDVERLTNAVFDDGRARPIVLVSVASDTGMARVNLDALAEVVGNSAAMVVLGTPAASWLFTDMTRSQLSVYGGGIRIIHPDIRDGSEGQLRHPLYITYADDDPQVTIERIRDELNRAVETKRSERQRSDSLEYDDESSDAYSQYDELVRKLEEERARADEERERAKKLASEASRLRKGTKSLEDQIDDLKRRLHGHGVFADPGRQFEHEVWLSWLQSMTESDRERWPLRSYEFGPDFLNSVAEQEHIGRERLVAICVDVVSQRVWSLPSRKPAPVGHESDHRSPICGEDGSALYRARIQTAAPAARRLMWWERPDGSVELVIVATHDDLSLTC